MIFLGKQFHFSSPGASNKQNPPDERPYKTDQDLPEKVKNNLPPTGQHIYREAFNHAYDEYRSHMKRRNSKEESEKIAQRVAWTAVKHKYEKGGDGQWHEK